MKEKEITELKKLHANVESLYVKFQNSLGSLSSKLSEVTEKEIICEYLPGDGVGVQLDVESNNSYMGFSQAIALIKEKGTIDRDDKTYF